MQYLVKLNLKILILKKILNSILSKIELMHLNASIQYIFYFIKYFFSTCENGEWICSQALCGSRCSAIGDPHYQTFDGKRYDFMGQCSYVLMKTMNFSIEAENVACSGSISEVILNN